MRDSKHTFLECEKKIVGGPIAKLDITDSRAVTKRMLSQTLISC